MLCRIFRHEGKAKASRNHSQGPVVAFTPVGRCACHSLLLEDMIGIASKLAIHSVNVGFAIELLDRKSAFVRKTMAAMNRDDHLLLKERHHVGTLIELFARQRVDDSLKVASEQTLSQVLGIGIAQS